MRQALRATVPQPHMPESFATMDTLTNLRTFLVVAQSGGFTDAAKRLNVVPSVVAKRIAQLEQAMDTRLFERSTRRVVITESGIQLRERASGLLAGFDDLALSVQRDDRKIEGHIRVMAPTTLTTVRLGQAFVAFMAQHRRITMEIVLVDRSSNPEEQSFDMAISGRTASYDGVIDVPLCSTHPVLVAAPAYLKSRPAPPAHPRDLIEHACLVFSPTGRRWSFQSSRGLQSVEVSAHMVADDNLTLLHAATAGMGIAVLPRYVATDAIRSGALECLLPAFPLQDHWFRAYVPKRRLRIARVQALVDWLVQDLTAFSEASAPR